ncbi:hypothetical protein UB39_12970 [Photobacterium angustum]|nr:hypothetical protein UB39_12970 [Photobacterium angustum]
MRGWKLFNALFTHKPAWKNDSWSSVLQFVESYINTALVSMLVIGEWLLKLYADGDESSKKNNKYNFIGLSRYWDITRKCI